jgi:hypothetical protein
VWGAADDRHGVFGIDVNCDKSGNDPASPNAGPGVSDEMATRLLALHDEYAAAVNAAIDENREELVDQLADEFSVVALELMTDELRTATERAA